MQKTILTISLVFAGTLLADFRRAPETGSIEIVELLTDYLESIRLV